MSWWSQLWNKLAPPRPPHLVFHADQELIDSLQILSETERRSTDEIAADLIHTALAQRQCEDFCLYTWEQLTPREQQITALLSRGYTNRQIAAVLGLSPETVKTHVRSILRKFQVHNRTELYPLLEGWDFDG
jgi:DNA-binding CsgD family transcriptional regulator